MPGGRPTKYTDELLTVCRHYLENYNTDEYDNDLFPSIEGMSLAVGVARQTLHVWAKEEDKEEFSYIYETLMSKQAKNIFSGAMGNTYNSTISKLMLTKHGYSDKVESETINKTSMTIKGLQVEYVDAENTDS
jgi:hypothetical protein